jgi:hypothetical protein
MRFALGRIQSGPAAVLECPARRGNRQADIGGLSGRDNTLQPPVDRRGLVG